MDVIYSSLPINGIDEDFRLVFLVDPSPNWGCEVTKYRFSEWKIVYVLLYRRELKSWDRSTPHQVLAISTVGRLSINNHDEEPRAEPWDHRVDNYLDYVANCIAADFNLPDDDLEKIFDHLVTTVTIYRQQTISRCHQHLDIPGATDGIGMPRPPEFNVEELTPDDFWEIDDDRRAEPHAVRTSWVWKEYLTEFNAAIAVVSQLQEDEEDEEDEEEAKAGELCII